MIYEHDFEIGLENLTVSKEVTNKFLFQCLENISAKYSEEINDSTSEVINDISWILVEWKLCVINRPEYLDTLNVKCWARNDKNVYIDYEMCVKNKVFAKATAKFVLVNKKDMSTIKVTDEIVSKYKPINNKRVFDSELERLYVKENYDKTIDFHIRKSDIDINNHMHNLNYLDAIKEIIDIDKELNNLIIVYKKQIKYGENISISMLKENDKYAFKMFNKDNGEIKTIIEMN